MKTIIHTVLCLLFIPLITSCSNASKSNLTAEQQTIVHLVLSQTSEVKIHQMRGAIGNTVYLHADGHKEAVYNENGKLVQDGINDGSYNYEHPVNNPFGHYVKDIEPWIKWGNSKSDPTTVNERIYAYMGDLEGGIRKARELWPHTSIDTLNSAQPQTGLPKSLNKIFNYPQTKALFGLVKGELEYSDENVISTMKALDAAFNEVY